MRFTADQARAQDSLAPHPEISADSNDERVTQARFTRMIFADAFVVGDEMICRVPNRHLTAGRRYKLRGIDRAYFVVADDGGAEVRHDPRRFETRCVKQLPFDTLAN
jgi:hypothetical protein